MATTRRTAKIGTEAASEGTTKTWLSTLKARAAALDTIFACGGSLDLPAPLVLRPREGKALAIVETVEYRPTNVATKLAKWCAPAAYGDGRETRIDTRIRDGLQLYARDGAFAVEGFDDALKQILVKIREELCPHHATPPVATLHSLNLYQLGGHFVAHKDTPREVDVFGTLVVCLPLSFDGGKLIVERGSRTTFDWAFSPYSTRAEQRAGLKIRWAAFFGDVDHCIEPVREGCRATLTYELRRAPRSEVPSNVPQGDAETAFTQALLDALAEPSFAPNGATLGVPCLHLYAVEADAPQLPGLDVMEDTLKGRDHLVASALRRAGLAPRVAPYLFESCVGESWRLRRDANAKEKRIFTRKRVGASQLEETLPIEFHAEWDNEDDVKWLLPPPWVSRSSVGLEGRPEPAAERLGEIEYSPTDYFGNEAAYSTFYTAAAILFEVPTSQERKQRKTF